MDSGNGFTLTDEEAHLVYRLVSDAFTRASDENVQRVIGNEDAVNVAAELYVRMAEAMQRGRFP
jgi:hypothetical protein